MRDDVGVQRQHRGVAARMVAVHVRVDDVANGLVGDLAQLRHDAVVIHRELVVDEEHGVVADDHRDVPRRLAADQLDVVPDLRRRKLGRGEAALGVCGT
jgi:hypothetical protein